MVREAFLASEKLPKSLLAHLQLRVPTWILRKPALSLFCAFPPSHKFVLRANDPKKDATQLDFLNLCKDPNTSTIPLSLGTHHLAPSLASLVMRPSAPLRHTVVARPFDPTCSAFGAHSCLARLPHFLGHSFLARAGLH